MSNHSTSCQTSSKHCPGDPPALFVLTEISMYCMYDQSLQGTTLDSALERHGPELRLQCVTVTISCLSRCCIRHQKPLRNSTDTYKSTRNVTVHWSHGSVHTVPRLGVTVQCKIGTAGKKTKCTRICFFCHFFLTDSM